MRKIVIDLVYVLIISVFAVSAISASPLESAVFAKIVFLLIESIVLYTGLSLLMRYAVRRTVAQSGENRELTADSQKVDSDFFYRKLFIIAIACIPPIFNLYSILGIRDTILIKTSHIAGIGFLFLGFFFLIKFIQQLVIQKENKYVPLSEVIFRYIGYYNPDDKRTVVEKQIGMGTTVNFATNGGKLFAIFMIFIPFITIFVILIAILVH